MTVHAQDSEPALVVNPDINLCFYSAINVPHVMLLQAPSSWQQSGASAATEFIRTVDEEFGIAGEEPFRQHLQELPMLAELSLHPLLASFILGWSFRTYFRVSSPRSLCP